MNNRMNNTLSEKKNCFYDILGSPDRVYTQHFKTDGFVQDWLHFHSKYELTLVVSGNVEINDNGAIIATERPHIRLHRPYTFHTANAKAGVTYECFVFYFTEESLKNVSCETHLRDLFTDSLQIIELDADQLEAARTLASMVMLDISDRLLAVTLGGLLTIAEENLQLGKIKRADKLSDTSYIGDVLEYINKNIGEKISVSELSKQFFVSEQKLSSDFKRRIKETLHHYIVSARVSHSAMLIAKGVPPLTAALECGFSDETHFAKTFKSRMGMTPYQFSKSTGKSLEYPEDFDPKNTTITNNPPRFY